MENRDDLTKILAVAGTILAWFPILAPIVISTILFLVQHIFRFDYLMPAELFPFALAGSGLLLWATLRAHSHVKIVAWGFSIAVLVLSAGQGLAVVSGLASGETEAAGLVWFIVIASLAVYSLGIILVGMGGLMLLRDLFRKGLPAV